MCTTIQLEHSIMIWRIIYYNINDHMKSPKSLIIKLLFFLLDSSNKNYLFVQNLCNNDANIRIIFSLNIFHCLNYKLVGTNKNCVFFCKRMDHYIIIKDRKYLLAETMETVNKKNPK